MRRVINGSKMLVSLEREKKAVEAEAELIAVQGKFYNQTALDGVVLRFTKNISLFYSPWVDGDQIASKSFRGTLVDVSHLPSWRTVIGARLCQCFRLVNECNLVDAVQLQFQQRQTGEVRAIQIEAWSFLKVFHMTFTPAHDPLTLDPAWYSDDETAPG
jgi:hypothetical protein